MRGRLLEGLRLARTLWRGQPVDWDGLWTLRGGLLGVTPHPAGGPPVWIAGSLPVSLQRAGEHFDGWLPNAGDALQWGQRSAQIRAVAREAGRNPDRLEGAM